CCQFQQSSGQLTMAVVSTVADVYDAASAIGKDFELLIDRYGPDCVSGLMPKVIGVLEELESVTSQREDDARRLAELERCQERLDQERRARQSDRARHERELEQSEDLWRGEAKDLSDALARCQEENKRLLAAAASSASQKAELNDGTIAADRDGAARLQQMPDLQGMAKLKATIEAQRDEIRRLQRDLAQCQTDSEALQSQSDRLARANAEYRRRHSVSSRQAQRLLESQADLEARLAASDQALRLAAEAGTTAEGCADASPEPALMTQEQLMERLRQDGKLVIDKSDPNRPRFTLCELRDVLTERNELKVRLIEVEEELVAYKQASEKAAAAAAAASAATVAPEDAPVQGPINREPDEKLFPQDVGSRIGIKHFFQGLLDRVQN
uniref:RH1 domain-containing protein n=1 Tax=Macrostomum lignano TaxID=282301 RepID=A0A1I8G1R5_9PLAT